MIYKFVYISRVEGTMDDLGQALLLEGEDIPLLYWRYNKLEKNYRFAPIPGTSGGLINRKIASEIAEAYAAKEGLPLFRARNYSGQPMPANETAQKDIEDAHNRDFTLRVRLNDTEIAHLQALADKASLNLSEYVRQKIF